jgi:HD-like signal output (HDOD) protein
MSQAAHQWVDTLAAESLPVLLRTLTQVRDLLNQPNVNHHRLAEVISRDPGFSLHIIRQFNSLPNAPQEPVSKISLAIPLLGMAHVERASRSLTCLEERLKGPPRRGLVGCYSRAVHAALYASAVALRRRDPDEGSVYTAALLHDIGEMALWSREPQQMRQVENLILKGDDHDGAAMEVFGCTLREISCGLSEAWHLPDLVRVSQGLHNSYQPRPLIVMLASALARQSSLGWQRTRTLDDVELLAEFLDIPLEKALTWFHGQAAEAARRLQTLPIPLPAFHLIHGEVARVQKTPSAPGKIAAATVEAPHPTSPVKKPAAATAKTPATGPAKKPASTPGKTSNPLQQLITTALQEIRQEHGLQRAMFAVLNTNKTELRARLVTEESTHISLKEFSVNLATPSLFSLLMKKPQAIALSPSNAQKYQHLIPEPLLGVINSKQCLAMSVFLHNKPIGLFYADNGLKQAITPQQFVNFKAICQCTILTLS